MTYDDFKTYLINHLWKLGDTTVINALDTLIATANAELNRDLKLEDRNVMSSLSITAGSTDFPPDYRSMRSIIVDGIGELAYVTPAQFAAAVQAQPGTPLNIYSTTKTQVLLSVGASVDTPVSAVLEYYSNIPDFKTAGESWVADDYFDVYLYCVLKHTGTFLREDERVPLWVNLYKSALDSALIENDDVKYSGSPLQIQFPFMA